MTPDSV